MIKLKRVYEKSSKSDGFRILVDRLWPRGLTKRKAKVDLWLKDIAPSSELRRWFGHDPRKWKEFYSGYSKELKQKKDLLNLIREKTRERTITLIYGAKDKEHNEALILKEKIDKLNEKLAGL